MHSEIVLIFPFSHIEYLKNLKTLKKFIDYTPVRLLKTISPYKVKPLAHMIIQALSEVVFLDHLKLTRVTTNEKKKR